MEIFINTDSSISSLSQKIEGKSKNTLLCEDNSMKAEEKYDEKETSFEFKTSQQSAIFSSRSKISEQARTEESMQVVEQETGASFKKTK